ncbi:hypothetical protein AURDEDRAFT_164184 [Auricularia subglabra TFB-10046 SS5]|nr:hypothetical protein AURDEDRAFT_164184 [Auricularia subglabra TFB-10046 SS5]
MALQPQTYPRASAALAGLGLTTQLAFAATDGLPIVKQIIGVVARIITLGQEIEARRDALLALVEDARAIGRSVEAIVSERELEGEMLASLEALHSVLNAVEKMLSEHRAKSRLQRALRYAFTVQKHVNRLGQELSRALVAALDTNAYVKDSARCIGKFRLIRDFEVDKLDLVAEETHKGASYTVKYYTARIEGSGQVFAVRYFEKNAPSRSESAAEDDYIQQRICDHDRILEEISTVQKAHPNIARFYGRSSGSITSRFTFHEAYHLAEDMAGRMDLDVGGAFSIALQVIDAACYLEEIGAIWFPIADDHIFMDEAGKPTIGLKNDLRAVSNAESYQYDNPLSACGSLLIHCAAAQTAHPPFELVSDMFPNFPLGEVFNATDWLRTRRQVAPRTLLTSHSFGQKTSTYLQKMVTCLNDRPIRTPARELAAAYFRPAVSSTARGTVSFGEYRAYRSGEDLILLARIDDTEEEIRHSEQHAGILPDHAAEVRKQLQIPIPDPWPEDVDYIHYRVFRTPGDEGISNFVEYYRRSRGIVIA